MRYLIKWKGYLVEEIEGDNEKQLLALAKNIALITRVTLEVEAFEDVTIEQVGAI